MAEPTDESGYHRLREQVAGILPADAKGRRRPAERRGVRSYWELGRLLNEHITGRAAYGQRAVVRLAEDLGLLPRTLYRARKLHQRLPAGSPALEQLSWSHCRLLATIDDDDELQRLMGRAADEGWSVRRLEQQLQGAEAIDSEPARGRPGSYRLVACGDPAAAADPAADAGPALAFDLGFGIRRSLAALGRGSKRTRRLCRELAAGDVVEVATDDKGRPALRRIWGQVEARLYTYPVCLLDASATGALHVQLDLGFDVTLDRTLRLRGSASLLDRGQLQARLTADGAVVAKTYRVGADYEADLWGLADAAEARVVAEHGEHLNALWGAP